MPPTKVNFDIAEDRKRNCTCCYKLEQLYSCPTLDLLEKANREI